MAEQQHVLGLTHNPFASPQGAFFEGGDRKTHLEHLRHLSQWSRRVLLVTGPPDAGKTMLYRQLSATLEPRAKAARINAALINAPREVLAAIVQGFGLAAPADANIQLLTDVIIAHVEDQQSHQRFCVILIDDAELLDSRAVEQLLKLVGRCPIRLVLFAEMRLVQVVDRLAKRLDVSWHELRLSGLSQSDVREYLEWRFKQARYRGRLPFTDLQVKEITRLSEGLPGRVNEMANVLLAKLQSGEIEPSRGGFPMLHRAILGVLSVIILLAYLLFRPTEDAEPPDLVRAPLPTPVPELPEPAPTEVDTLAEPAAGPATPPADADGSARVAATAKATVTDAGAAESGATAPEPSVREPEALPPAASAGGAEPVSAPEPAAPAAGPSQTALPAGPRNADWILRQPPDHFTLQLLTSGSAERAAEYAAERKRPEDFAIYRLRRDGQLLHVVVYGAFSSRAAAERAATTAEATAGGVKPWVRPFGLVQEAVRSTPQN